MEKWEYNTVYFWYDSGAKVWKHWIKDLSPQPNLHQILDHFGAKGWELVSCTPYTVDISTEGMGGLRYPVALTAGQYQAIFKRRVGEQ